jgi:hypothetical protein
MEEPVVEATAQVEETSAEYLGKWNRLVSSTNWEKGRIICQWRQQLIESGAPASSYSDDAWSRRVGNVSSQHVGRLRRVFQRFTDTADQYPGLYWSHFQAALDWPDAEMYLEGAVQNQWSVAQMRNQRWEAMGAPAEDRPGENDFAAVEYDEDAPPFDDGQPAATLSDETVDVRDPQAAGGDFDHLSDSGDDGDSSRSEETAGCVDEPAAAEAIRPFENLPTLPGDLNEAFERFKVAIVSHKIAGWQAISRDQMLGVLESLKQLVLAP